jgi:hypothetical protein
VVPVLEVVVMDGASRGDGGTVTSSSDMGMGIRGGTIQITGGSVQALDVGGSLLDSKGAPAYKVIIPGAADSMNFTTVDLPLADGGHYAYSGYGHPSDTNLYFYQPNGVFAFDVVVAESGSTGCVARIKPTGTTAGHAATFAPYIVPMSADGAGLTCSVVPSNTVSEVLGADTVSANGDWNWQTVDYFVDPDGGIRLTTPVAFRIFRLKFAP